LDTGATDHVTYDKNSFTTFFRIKPMDIKLPNDSHIIANYVGTIKFTNKLVIYNDLYIPEFVSNLISVP